VPSECRRAARWIAGSKRCSNPIPRLIQPDRDLALHDRAPHGTHRRFCAQTYGGGEPAETVKASKKVSFDAIIPSFYANRVRQRRASTRVRNIAPPHK